MVVDRPASWPSSMVAWLRGSHRLGSAEASRLVKVARALREQLPATAAGSGSDHQPESTPIADPEST
ncbi:MAG: DUF222 domain-containing protein [Geodermatophilaceae bacterium]|nr:DUF222 domain-containing protein [Geodermatophilaceae bacterium]